MDNVDFLPLQTRGSMELTVVFIEPAIRATDRHVGGLAVLDTPALGQVGVPVEHTLAALAAELLLAGRVQPVLPVEPWGEQRMHREPHLPQQTTHGCCSSTALTPATKVWEAESAALCRAAAQRERSHRHSRASSSPFSQR